MRAAGAVGGIWRLADRVRRRGSVAAVVLIDAEPDLRIFDPSKPSAWSGFELTCERIPSLRERLSDIGHAPIAFTWLIRMDPQIAKCWGSAGWAAAAYEAEFSRCVESGDEVGLHTHPWRWLQAESRWVAD